MAQPSVACYFSSRKRSAIEDSKINRAKKVLVLDSDQISEKSCVAKELYENVDNDVKSVVLPTESFCKSKQKDEKNIFAKKVITISNSKSVGIPKNENVKSSKPKNAKLKSLSDNHNIQELFYNMKSKVETELLQNKFQSHVTPPGTPTKIINALDKVKEKPDGPSIKEIRRKITRSGRLAELKASISRFQEGENKLKEIEKETKKIPESPKLKSFHTIELEVVTR